MRLYRLASAPRVVVALVAGIAMAGSAAAQSLSSPTLTNNSNPNELFLGSPSVPSFERESTVQLVSSSVSGVFVVRYASLVTADGDGAGSSGLGEALFSDYQLDFTASAPGAYILQVDTQLRGELHLVNDGPNGGSVDIGSVTGSSSLSGSVVGGTLNLADPGSTSGSLGASNQFDSTASATVFAVSNGATNNHRLRFQWFQIANTDAGGGDEAALRLGATSDVPSETAGDYPGSPARVQDDDGHFVTVTLISLCGNGSIDTGPSYAEQCDDGPDNGQPGSCCSATCTFVLDGTSCDDGNACTTGDSCTTGICVGGTPQSCPLCQTCNPMGGCMQGPRTGCKEPLLPGKASFQLKDAPVDTADQVTFKWIKGDATATSEFGNPATTHDIALCVFSPSGLVMQTTAPAGGTCGSRPCWKPLGVTGFSYKDSQRTPDGLDKVVLKAGLAGKAKAQVKGKGPNVPALPLPLQLPAVVQVQSESGSCWEATFDTGGVSRNDSTQFKGKAAP